MATSKRPGVVGYGPMDVGSVGFRDGDPHGRASRYVRMPDQGKVRCNEHEIRWQHMVLNKLLVRQGPEPGTSVVRKEPRGAAAERKWPFVDFAPWRNRVVRFGYVLSLFLLVVSSGLWRVHCRIYSGFPEPRVWFLLMDRFSEPDESRNRMPKGWSRATAAYMYRI